MKKIMLAGIVIGATVFTMNVGAQSVRVGQGSVSSTGPALQQQGGVQIIVQPLDVHNNAVGSPMHLFVAPGTSLDVTQAVAPTVAGATFSGESPQIKQYRILDILSNNNRIECSGAQPVKTGDTFQSGQPLPIQADSKGNCSARTSFLQIRE